MPQRPYLGSMSGNKNMTKYSPEYPNQLRTYAATHQKKFGCTQDEVAQLFGVSRKTVTEWLKKFPEFKEAFDECSRGPNALVENATLKRALGYEYVETKEKSNGDIEITTKHIPGDVTAQRFWLQNRDPERWRTDELRISGHISTEQTNELKEFVENVLDKHPEAKADLVARLRAKCSDEIAGNR